VTWLSIVALVACSTFAVWVIVRAELAMRRCERERKRLLEERHIGRYVRTRWGEGNAPRVEHSDSLSGPWLPLPFGVVTVWKTESAAGVYVADRGDIVDENGHVVTIEPWPTS
jgi:hypothetical protein